MIMALPITAHTQPPNSAHTQLDWVSSFYQICAGFARSLYAGSPVVAGDERGVEDTS